MSCGLYWDGQDNGFFAKLPRARNGEQARIGSTACSEMMAEGSSAVQVLEELNDSWTEVDG